MKRLIREDADVILLNTCAIRENAENKVFGELGHLKTLKLEKPDLINRGMWMYVTRRIGRKSNFAETSTC